MANELFVDLNYTFKMADEDVWNMETYSKNWKAQSFKVQKKTKTDFWND